MAIADAFGSGAKAIGDLYNTQILRARSAYANPMLAAELQKNNLENQFYAPHMESEIDYRNAAKKSLDINNQYDPEKLGLANRYQGLVNEWYPEKARAEIEAQKAMANYRNMGGLAGGVGGKMQITLENQIARQNPNFTPEQRFDAANAYLEGRDTLSDGTPLPPAGGLVRSTLDQIVKQGTTAGALNQQRYAATLEGIFNQADTVAPNAFKFAGAAGKFKGGIDALRAQRGENDPEYRDYLVFTRQVIPSMASEILRTGGANGTDTQKLLAIQSANPIEIDNNPELAMEQYKFLKELYKGIGKTVAQGTSETRAQLRSGLSNKHSSNINPDFTDENIKFTAKELGISEAEVRKKIGIG